MGGSHGLAKLINFAFGYIFGVECVQISRHKAIKILTDILKSSKTYNMRKFVFLFLLVLALKTYAQESGEKLFKAVFNHNLKSVKSIIEKDKLLVNYIRKINETFYIPVLMQAVINNETEIVKFLIANGADVNKLDGFKMTCLMWAANNQNIELVKLLLENGADKNAQDNRGMTALKAAEKVKNAEIIELLK